MEPSGYEEARDAEELELERERVRLWYVAATRARELLVLPRLDVAARASAWITVVDLALPELPSVDLEHYSPEVGMGKGATENIQTRAVFASEAAAVAACHRSIVWRVPSRDEGTAGSGLREEEPPLLVTDGEGAPTDGAVPPTIQGGRERGLILHKLIEEVLTGETAETAPALVARAETLIRALGRLVTDDPALGLVPAELAGCVVRALSIPEVAALRPGLQPEYPVYASTVTDTHEEVTDGIVDAIAFGPDGAADVVIDWKSDVDPSPETLEHYCSQVRAYLDATGAARGLVIALTPGKVTPVMPSRASNGITGLAI